MSKIDFNKTLGTVNGLDYDDRRLLCDLYNASDDFDYYEKLLLLKT